MFIVFVCVFLAIEITGHSSPIIVGTTGTINCSTVLNASKIEWLLVGIESGDAIEETVEDQYLALSLSPEATELDGAKLTCRVTTESGKIFEQTITVHVKGQHNDSIVPIVHMQNVIFNMEIGFCKNS